ncbi:hypothetical protein ACFVS2_25555 [Brevibacillus sp. NPDC058079]|uniref:flagellin N-terminal helical domain-containing protein n=1 Tax=Brevibacillus sp. NPDC058079 TaxID=3346330 RepID=UPI0036EECEED
MFINSIGNSILNAMNYNQREINKSTTRISTGKMLPSDNPADFVRSSRIEAESRVNRVVEQNIQDGLAFLSVADETLSYVDQMGKRLRELATQYQTGTLSDDTKTAIKNEAKALVKEMVSVIKNAEFNGKKVFGSGSIKIQVGSNPNDQLEIKMPDAKSNMPNALSTTKDNQIMMPSQKGVLEHSTLPINRSMMLAVYGSPSPMREQGKVVSANKESDTIPRYTISPPTVNIPDQKGYTGYKKIVDEKGNLLYEGNLKDGEFDGYGKLYDSNGKLMYEGDWNEGVIDGYGTVYNKNGKVSYQGNSKNGVADGYGTFYGTNGKITYQGSLKDGYREGWGTTYDTNGKVIESKHYTDYQKQSEDTGNNGNNGNGGTGNTGGTGNNGNGGSGNNGNGGTGNTGGTGNNGNAGNGGNGGSIPGNIGDWDKINIDDLLNGKDIIDKILDQVSDSRGDIGIMESIMERRLQFTENMRSIQEDWLNRLQSTNMTKELMNKAKHEMLQQVNANLMNTMMEQYRSMVMTLLKSM